MKWQEHFVMRCFRNGIRKVRKLSASLWLKSPQRTHQESQSARQIPQRQFNGVHGLGHVVGAYGAYAADTEGFRLRQLAGVEQETTRTHRCVKGLEVIAGQFS